MDRQDGQDIWDSAAAILCILFIRVQTYVLLSLPSWVFVHFVSLYFVLTRLAQPPLVDERIPMPLIPNRRRRPMPRKHPR